MDAGGWALPAQPGQKRDMLMAPHLIDMFAAGKMLPPQLNLVELFGVISSQARRLRGTARDLVTAAEAHVMLQRLVVGVSLGAAGRSHWKAMISRSRCPKSGIAHRWFTIL